MLKSQANNYFENNLLDNVILNEIHLLYVFKILLIIKMFQMPRIILYLQSYNTNQGLQELYEYFNLLWLSCTSSSLKALDYNYNYLRAVNYKYRVRRFKSRFLMSLL